MQANTLNVPNSLNMPLSNGVDDSVTAGRLRESRMKAFYSGEPMKAVEAGREQSLRELVMGARRALDLKQQAKDKVVEKVAAPMKMATSSLLKSAWISLPAEALTLFFPSLLYINLHVFGKVIFGEAFFCRLGEEWIPKTVHGNARKKLEDAAKGLGIIEAGFLFVLDLMVLFIIISVLSIIGFVGYAMTAGIWETMKIVWGLSSEILKAFAI